MNCGGFGSWYSDWGRNLGLRYLGYALVYGDGSFGASLLITVCFFSILCNNKLYNSRNQNVITTPGCLYQLFSIGLAKWDWPLNGLDTLHYFLC